MIIKVNTGRPYAVHIDSGLLSHCGALLADICGKRRPRLAIVADDQVASIYGKTVVQSFSDAGFSTCMYRFPHGEASKNLSTVQALYSFFAENAITRSDMAVALGGGVTGDLVGFASATWLRGVEFMQIPTSLLAMVDSSVGGKTGVDLPYGKNLVGAFWQPSLVVCDPNVLQTLSPEYLADGTAEVIKYGAILDAPFFNMLEKGGRDNDLTALIGRCVELKKQVVERDERDKGVRQWLNFGHTFGHALEKYSNYAISHGCGVAIGMVLLTRACELAKITPAGTADRIAACCRRYGLPDVTDAPIDILCKLCLGDKKRDGDTLSLVALKEIGQAFLYPIPAGELPALMREVKQ